jgi:predicted amidohydrolase
MTATVKVAAAQLSPIFLDKEKTAQKASSAI